VTLRADRRDCPRIVTPFFRQPHQRSVVRVIERRKAVARITIDTKRGEGIGFRINRGRVTSGAADTKFL
jgi:hypothetical protein